MNFLQNFLKKIINKLERSKDAIEPPKRLSRTHLAAKELEYMFGATVGVRHPLIEQLFILI